MPIKTVVESRVPVKILGEQIEKEEDDKCLPSSL